ncbi:MAG: STAS domain-containing protein [Ferruginibacter sp.]
MNVKTDTKEKFVVITPGEPELSANMAGDFQRLLEAQMNTVVSHLVLNMEEVRYVSKKVAEILIHSQQQYYENHFSFVICCLQKQVENALDEMEILELMNVTPTESEAWDIVQMEEIEREIMGGED